MHHAVILHIRKTGNLWPEEATGLKSRQKKSEKGEEGVKGLFSGKAPHTEDPITCVKGSLLL